MEKRNGMTRRPRKHMNSMAFTFVAIKVVISPTVVVRRADDDSIMLFYERQARKYKIDR